ncbi:GNAT family N-acetyltransferase [Nocardia stercoris]|uniref:GNAT family N-acetyltransferase n=1 Tax=Nocardia stercoris TaxID=2483361 RepID=UPI001F2E1AF4|nr:GNAT family N-acetyltransferase [Nocardia stercoris]
MTKRDEQRRATRLRILDAAAELLAGRGYSALTTVAVQDAAGLSRGALLHHFPTTNELTTALVAHLVERNEAETRSVVTRLGPAADPVHRALTALDAAMSAPSAQAEQELWAAARTDPDLARVLRSAERRAGRDLLRVVDELFGAELTAHPGYPAVRDLTVTMLRGIAAARPLRTTAHAERLTLDRWAAVVRILLADTGELHIRVDDLSGPEIATFLREHVTEMAANSPAGSMHALDLDALRAPGVTFWTAWQAGELVACGAISDLGAGHAELKSMRTARTRTRSGLASKLLSHILSEAKARGFTRISLETGSRDFYAPAQRLYLKHGFDYCEPFGNYRPDPHSVFMTRALGD